MTTPTPWPDMLAWLATDDPPPLPPAAAPFPEDACDCGPDCGRCIYPGCR
jgi:hypothetical protein